MATSIVLSLDTRRAKADGSYPVIMRLTHNSQTTGIKSGYWVKEKDWDDKKRLVKSGYKGTESPRRLNNFLAKRKSEMIDIITKLADKGELRFMTLTQVKDRLQPSGHSKTTFYGYTEALITELIKARRIGTARSYKDMLGAIRGFTNQRDFAFHALNASFLKRFETWHLSKEGNGLNGLAVYLRTIRAVYNKAIKDGLAEKEAYPFDHYTIRTSKPRKRALPLDAIRKIIALDLAEHPKLVFGRDVFLMSFYLQGMPFADMAHLKLSDIVDGRVVYARQKTDRPVDVRITPQLDAVLSRYTAAKGKDAYLLPVIKRTDPTGQYKDVKWAIKRYNKQLKLLGSLAGIEERLTSYVARHSFASLADEREVPVTAIRDMLGHQKISTTEAYLSDLRKSKMNEYQDRVFDDM